MTTVSTTKLSINSHEKIMSGDMSEIGDSSFIQIYPDACDVGIMLTSHKTGITTRWFHESTHRGNENEINFWELCPVPEDVRKFPNLADWVIRIWND